MSEKLKVTDTSKDHVIVATEAQDIQLTRAIIGAYGSTTALRFVQMVGDMKPINRMNEAKGDPRTITLYAAPIVHNGVLDLTKPADFATAIKPLLDAEIAKLPTSSKAMSRIVGLRREIEVNTTRGTTTVHAAFAFDG